MARRRIRWCPDHVAIFGVIRERLDRVFLVVVVRPSVFDFFFRMDAITVEQVAVEFQIDMIAIFVMTTVDQDIFALPADSLIEDCCKSCAVDPVDIELAVD